jgi:hypothetical protein
LMVDHGQGRAGMPSHFVMVACVMRQNRANFAHTRSEGNETILFTFCT